MLQGQSTELGWHPDLPDWRDLTLNADQVSPLLRNLAPLESRPTRVDWREYCGEVDDETDIPSSTRACVALLEQCERRVTGQGIELSKQFVRRSAVRLAESCAEPPCSLRVTWKAIVRLGTPSAYVWPGTAENRTNEPDAFVYSMARNYADLLYIRLDPRGQFGSVTLEVLRSCLAAGFSFVFGLPLYTSLTPEGEIGFPTRYDLDRGGQALMAVGYDDEYRVRSDRGCFQVRGCWGREWGDRGYGWLPYTYVREQLARDFWTATQPSWLASREFLRPWQ